MARKSRSSRQAEERGTEMNGCHKPVSNGTAVGLTPSVALGKAQIYIGLVLVFVAISVYVMLLPPQGINKTPWVSRPVGKSPQSPPPHPDMFRDFKFIETEAWSTAFTCRRDHFIHGITYTFMPGDASDADPDQKEREERRKHKPHAMERLQEISRNPPNQDIPTSSAPESLSADRPGEEAQIGSPDPSTDEDEANIDIDIDESDLPQEDEDNSSDHDLPPGLEPIGEFTLTLYDALFTWFQQHYKEGVAVKFRPRDLSENFLTWQTLHDTDGNIGGFPTAYGPCAPLVYCLGHQACMFRFSNEFCLQDPIPGYQKVLNINIQCRHDSGYVYEHELFNHTLPEMLATIPFRMTPKMTGIQYDDPLIRKYVTNGDAMSYVAGGEDRVREWPEKVMFVTYLSQIEKGIRDYANTALLPLEILEQSVFTVECPSVADAYELGYRGQCDNEPPPKGNVSDRMWSKLGRCPVAECREELLSVYCAYQLNPNGLCVPPFMIDAEKDTPEAGLPPTFNFRFMPKNGKRYDLTTYNKIFQDKHMGLIPVRIGFIILAHAAPFALFQLIDHIYRPQHFYVIHVDSRNPDVRDTLDKMVRMKFGAEANIRVLPKERSFATQWSAYLSTRAHLQGYEELMRMGVWDYAFLISGNDLPIRSMEDLAASLGPYRGFSLQRPFLVRDRHFDIWHTCDDHAYLLGHRDEPTFTQMAGSTWSLYTRNFLEVLLSEDRPLDMQEAHFSLMTRSISDEFYVASMVNILPEFRTKVIKRAFHQLRSFYGKNIDNTCRRSDVTDRCGQGPPELEARDMNFVLLSSNNFFFARKFSMDTSDVIRNNVMHYYHNDRYKELNLKHHFSDTIVRSIAELLISRPVDEAGIIKSVTSVQEWRVVPVYTGKDCCTRQWLSRLVLPFRIFIDLQAVNERGDPVDIRASFVSQTEVPCFTRGNLRSVDATSRPPINPMPDTPDGNPNIHASPVPTQPLAGDMHVFLWLDREENERHCLELDSQTDTADKPAHSTFYTIPLESPEEPRELYIEVTDEQGHHVCNHTHKYNLDQSHLDHETNYTFKDVHFGCPDIHTGWNTFTITEVAKVDAYEYSIRLYFANDSTADSYEADVLPVIPQLWALEDAVALTDTFGEAYYEGAQILTKT